MCSFCRYSNNILAAADRSGLNGLKLVEAESGKIFYLDSRNRRVEIMFDLKMRNLSV